LRPYFENPVISPPFHTRPLHQPDQPLFLNATLVGRSSCDAEALLAVAKGLEWTFGRRRGARFGPRPLDVDVLLIGDLVIERPELSIPHPRLRVRRFVLAPLAEIAPDLEVPPDGSSVRELLSALAEEQIVEKGTWSSPPL
jgi:2-amino-4-hydroxy-6-hydroxymethyldihydropteridine diphosphokinase